MVTRGVRHFLGGIRAGPFCLRVYRRLYRVDASDHAEWMRTRPFELLGETEADMRFYFGDLRDNPQVLAAEL
jgi:hypothetical protein